MARFSALTEEFEEVTILDRPAIFTSLRIDRSTVPDGYHLYEVRHDDSGWGDAVQIARIIIVNHLGSLITCSEIGLPLGGYLDIGPEALNYGTGDCTSMEEYMNKYPPETKQPRETGERGAAHAGKRD